MKKKTKKWIELMVPITSWILIIMMTILILGLLLSIFILSKLSHELTNELNINFYIFQTNIIEYLIIILILIISYVMRAILLTKLMYKVKFNNKVKRAIFIFVPLIYDDILLDSYRLSCNLNDYNKYINCKYSLRLMRLTFSMITFYIIYLIVFISLMFLLKYLQNEFYEKFIDILLYCFFVIFFFISFSFNVWYFKSFIKLKDMNIDYKGFELIKLKNLELIYSENIK
ncbi:hypothetical protein ACXYRQ_04150 [Mycoplasma sp. 394]|uniref:hypothetical protein n=1 Tax=Mycoplasma sp. 6243 TaxID=3440865 RepID=UPI003EBEC9B0